MQNKHISMSEQTPEKIYSITKPNSAKLGRTISEEVTLLRNVGNLLLLMKCYSSLSDPC